VWRTTKLIECGYRGLQDYRLTRYFYVFTFLINFFKIQKRDILRFCRVSYVLSNSEQNYDTMPFKVNWRYLYCVADFRVHGRQRWKGEGGRQRGRERQLRSLSYDRWWQWSLGYWGLQQGSYIGCTLLLVSVQLSACSIMPNTHRRRRRDSTVELSRVGGVYWIRD